MSTDDAEKVDVDSVTIDIETASTTSTLLEQPVDDDLEDGVPELPEDTDERRLSPAETEKVDELLESAMQTADSRANLKEGFYTDPNNAASWHHLSDRDILDHHRSGIYRHMRHPLGTVEPSSVSDRRRSTQRSSPHGVATVCSFTPSLCNVSEADNSVNTSLGESSDNGRLPLPSESAPLLAMFPLSSTGHESESPSILADISSSNPPTPEVFVVEPKVEFQVGPVMDLIDSAMTEPPLPSTRKYSRRGSDLNTPKVCFILGADPDDTESSEQPSTPIKRCPSKSSTGGGRMRHVHRAGSWVHRDLSQRRRLGSEVSFGGIPDVATEIEEAAMLDGADLADIASHRFEDTKANRRRKFSHHSAMASVVHIGQLENAVKRPQQPSALKKPKRPLALQQHKMFVELDELRMGENQEWAWQEKARWIKFEEEIQEDALRWGKPHVSSLSFHSLLELRRCIEQGVIILDLDATDLPTIATRVVDQLVASDQLPADSRGHVLKALLLKHRYCGQKFKVSSDGQQRHLAEQRSKIRRNLSHLNLFNIAQSFSGVSLKDLHPGGDHSGDVMSVHVVDGNGANHDHPTLSSSLHVSPALENCLKKRHSESAANGRVHDDSSNGRESSVAPLLRSSVTSPGSMGIIPPPPLSTIASESHILHRIPTGAEATNVLVGSVDFLQMPVMAFVRLRDACHLGNVTEVPLPVRFLFILLGPAGTSSLDYHEIGRSISTLMADQRFHDVAYIADSRRDLLNAINEFLHDSIVLPPGEYDEKTLLPIVDMARQRAVKKLTQKSAKSQSTTSLEKPDPYGDPLKRTGRFFGGLINDAKRRYPHYISDLKDALNIQCLAAFFFVYFACLSPAITFGGLLGDKTDKWMGVSEMLVATAVCGVVFALLSGQPLIIIGATGPIIVFEEAMYKICTKMDIEFLPFRWWVGLWIGAISTIVIMLEGSFLVRFVTRFTEEIFALLISLIFVYEVFKKLYYVFLRNPLHEFYPPPLPSSCNINSSNVSMSEFDNETSSAPFFTTWSPDNTTGNAAAVPCDAVAHLSRYGRPNTALLSLMLTVGTFLLAFVLKGFRNSQFLGRSLRRAIGDFGVPISIIVWVLIDFLIPNTYTEKLDVPDGIWPTAPHKRGWFINPLGISEALPVWAIFAALIPALLVFILLFMESQITSMIVNKKDRGLKKGSGYHLDLFVIGILAVVCGAIGVPYMCSATVRAVTHVSALSIYSRTHAPGEKPRLINVMEQRLTSLAVHVLIGVSALMGSLLRQVPLAVLFGIFLYMGIASMTGVQLLHRFKLMFMPVKHHPEHVGYVRRVRLWKMNLFTVIQLLCLALLWVVKSTAAALAFPFVLTLMVPMRLFILPLLFTTQELAELDRDEEASSCGGEDEPDFYVQAHMPV